MLVQTNSSNQLDDIYPNNLVEYPDVSPSHSNISPFLNSVSEHEFFKSHSIPSDESDLVTPEPEGLRPLPEIDASKSDSITDINYTESSLTNMDFSDTEEFEEEYPPILPHLPDQPFAFSLKSSEQFKLARKKGRNSKSVSEKASHSKNKDVSQDSNSESEPQSYPETSSTTDNKDSRVTGNDAFYIPWGSERDRLVDFLY
ncbi:hypothetical protein K7432_016458 [Basidiobolus ranarum]|uniref:Uncharacterized protein n=1 Tax=Basidiobolus ranarum TaxID=34480 RepID=A0ABR2WEP5_9FUNG